jgi:hypothetical protein
MQTGLTKRELLIGSVATFGAATLSGIPSKEVALSRSSYEAAASEVRATTYWMSPSKFYALTTAGLVEL